MLRGIGLEIPEGASLERVPAARSDAHRDNGCWSWTVHGPNGVPIHKAADGRSMAIGSHWPMWALVRYGVVAHKGIGGDIDIDPPDDVQKEALRAIRARRGLT